MSIVILGYLNIASGQLISILKVRRSTYVECLGDVSIRHVTLLTETNQPHQETARVPEDHRMYYNRDSLSIEIDNRKRALVLTLYYFV